eukprot:gb/GECG01009408.1/.p1 GENE.gb/GECG01009408.1/~~gb/GECG01009408.1/.p1  ORF type:complete len:369 (+),score=48.08 gb/GECG01009408.1/:1-1107(+)
MGRGNRGRGGGRGGNNNNNNRGRGGGREGGGNNNNNRGRGGQNNRGGGGRGRGNQPNNNRGRGGGGPPGNGNWAFSNHGQRWDQPRNNQPPPGGSGGARILQQAFQGAGGGTGGFSQSHAQQPSATGFGTNPWAASNNNGLGSNHNYMGNPWAGNNSNGFGSNTNTHNQGNPWATNGNGSNTNNNTSGMFGMHTGDNTPRGFSTTNPGPFSKHGDVNQTQSLNPFGMSQNQQQPAPTSFQTHVGSANEPSGPNAGNPFAATMSSNAFGGLSNQNNKPGLFTLPEHNAVNGTGTWLSTESNSANSSSTMSPSTQSHGPTWNHSNGTTDMWATDAQAEVSSLTEQQKAAFESSDFEDGHIPETPPPREYR